jgi:nicotinamidase-related amidase
LDASIVQAGKVLDFSRKNDLTTIHVKMESYAGDARDTGRSHRMSNYLIPPGSEWAAWLEETAPLPGEIVLTKTCSGAVTGTMLDLVLRNTGIKNVIVTGYYTDQCVESTIRDLADLGYLVFLVRDATIGSSPKRYQNTLENITGVYCRLLYADQVREYFEAPQPGIV